jgi:hypothetical protein
LFVTFADTLKSVSENQAQPCSFVSQTTVENTIFPHLFSTRRSSSIPLDLPQMRNDPNEKL